MSVDEHRYCDHCGAQITQDSNFCDACGHPLLESEESQATEPAIDRKEAHARSGSFMRQRIAWALIFGLLLIPIVLFIIWKDVGELSKDVWLSLGFFIVFTTILGVATLRKGGSTWKGQLVKVIERENGVQFIFNTDKGKKSLFGNASLMEYYSVGDQVIKVKGYDFPEKLNRDGKNQLCMVCGKVYPIGEKRCRACRYPSMDPQNFI